MSLLENPHSHGEIKNVGDPQGESSLSPLEHVVVFIITIVIWLLCMTPIFLIWRALSKGGG